MAITPFAFTPTTGLRDSTAYPTNPGSEAAARVQVQTGMDQLRDHINGQLLTDLAATYAAKSPTLATWIAPTLLNSWVNTGLTVAPAGYYKDDLGIVRIRGGIKSGTITGATTLFTLPVGYRPLFRQGYTVDNNGSVGTVTVEINGNIAIDTVSSSLILWLDTISFRAEQ